MPSRSSTDDSTENSTENQEFEYEKESGITVMLLRKSKKRVCC